MKINSNDIARGIRLATDTCAGDNFDEILSNFEEYDDDFMEFTESIKHRYEIDFEHGDKTFFELLECDSVYEVLEFVVLHNQDFAIADYCDKVA